MNSNYNSIGSEVIVYDDHMVIIIFLSKNSIKITKMSKDAIGNLTIKGNIL